MRWRRNGTAKRDKERRTDNERETDGDGDRDRERKRERERERKKETQRDAVHRKTVNRITVKRNVSPYSTLK